MLLEKVAPRIGKTIEELVAKWVIDLAPKPRPELSEEEYSAADERLRRQIVDLGYATGADNESIDADLARARDNHEAGGPEGSLMLLDTSGLLCYHHQGEPQQ